MYLAVFTREEIVGVIRGREEEEIAKAEKAARGERDPSEDELKDEELFDAGSEKESENMNQDSKSTGPSTTSSSSSKEKKKETTIKTDGWRVMEFAKAARRSGL